MSDVRCSEGYFKKCSTYINCLIQDKLHDTIYIAHKLEENDLRCHIMKEQLTKTYDLLDGYSIENVNWEEFSPYFAVYEIFLPYLQG